MQSLFRTRAIQSVNLPVIAEDVGVLGAARHESAIGVLVFGLLRLHIDQVLALGGRRFYLLGQLSVLLSQPGDKFVSFSELIL